MATDIAPSQERLTCHLGQLGRTTRTWSCAKLHNSDGRIEKGIRIAVFVIAASLEQRARRISLQSATSCC